jgi:hypothetical protein
MKSKILALIVWFTGFATVLGFTPLATAAPARILIIRHAENPLDPDDPHLSAKGYARAEALKKLFKIHPEYASKGMPFAIYASKYVVGENAARSTETVTPLAKSLGLVVRAEFKGKKAPKQAQEILDDKQLDGKMILIAWPHEDIPTLAQALNGDCPSEWPGHDVYDRVWEIDYSASGAATCVDLPESVMSGDSK